MTQNFCEYKRVPTSGHLWDRKDALLGMIEMLLLSFFQRLKLQTGYTRGWVANIQRLKPSSNTYSTTTSSRHCERWTVPFSVVGFNRLLRSDAFDRSTTLFSIRS